MSFAHTLAMAQVKGVRLAAVAEPKKENRERYVRFSTPDIEQRLADDRSFLKVVEKARKVTAACVPYAKYERMLEREPLDAVLVLTPHAFHHKQILDALEARLHVLVEKPMVSTAPHARDVVKAARKTRKVVGVVYQRRAEPSLVYMKETVRAGKLGKIEHMSFALRQDWFSLTKGTWRRSPKYACGGQLMDSGSHLMDAMLWISGLKPKRVFARVLSFGARVDVDSALIIEFANGAIGQVSIVGKTCMPVSEELVITGAEGAMRYECGRLCQYDGGGKKVVPKLSRGTGTTPVSNFVDAVRGRAKLMAPPESGLAVARLTDAALRSAKRGTFVNL